MAANGNEALAGRTLSLKHPHADIGATNLGAMAETIEQEIEVGDELDEKPIVREPVGRSPMRLALESVLIVVSVLLAFGLNEWRMQRADAQLTQNVIDGLYMEIQANLALLETMQPLHERLAESIATMDPAEIGNRAAFTVITEHRVDGGTLINPPAEAAWQTAVSTGALRLLDYETVSVVSRIYLGQRDAVGRTSERIADLAFGGSMFDPAENVQAIQAFLALMRELASQEAHLMEEYREGLRRLEQVR